MEQRGLCSIISTTDRSGRCLWILGCKFPQAGPLALRQLSDFIRLSQCLRHATPNAIASRRVRTSYKSKLKLKICTRSHQLSTSSPRMTNNSKHFVILNSAGASRVLRSRTNRSLRPSPAKQKNYHQRPLYHNKTRVSSMFEKYAGDFG